MFAVDMSKFSEMKLAGQKTSAAPKRRNHLLEDREVATQMLQSTLRKFCNMCTFFNIDPMHPQALHVALLMSCKTKDRMQLAQCYMETQGIELNIEDGKGALDALQTVSDWCVVLKYFKIAVGPMTELGDKMLKQMQNAVLQVGVSLSDTQVDSAVASFILYAGIRNTPTPRMLEQFLIDHYPNEKNSNLKSMKLASLFYDFVFEEQAFRDIMLNVCIASKTNEQWAIDIGKIVESQSFMKSTIVESQQSSGRLRLRSLARTIHVNKFVSDANTFRVWCSSCGFSATTSTQVQRLLYFIRLQTQPVSEDVYKHLYTDEVLQKSKSVTIQCIDAEAIQHIIQSMRVYMHNIAELIDFRAQCLHGLSLETRNKLSLAQILQLYTCMYQHDSVWEVCWKAVVPTMNHTIATARDKFCARYAFDSSSVVSTMIDCHVGARNIAKPSAAPQ